MSGLYTSIYYEYLIMMSWLVGWFVVKAKREGVYVGKKVNCGPVLEPLLELLYLRSQYGPVGLHTEVQ